MKQVSDVIKKAKKLAAARLVVAAAHDEYVIEAVNNALELGFVHPILIGNSKEILRIIEEKKYDEKSYLIIDANDDFESAELSVKLIKEKNADILMKGLIDTNILLKAVVNRETGIREAKLLSHVALLSYHKLNRVLFATDCAMNIAPDANQKILILENVLKLTKALGYKNPLVGIVSAVEKVNLKMASTVDAQIIKEEFLKGNIIDCVVDGPFAVDNLVSMEAVKHKGINSLVAGKADILLMPNIEAGNVFYKTSVFLAHAETAGIIIGAKAPIILTSRADSAEAKLFSIALGMVMYHES
ncbi:MAG TPA: bifunctional enoyl-CoA hydratase/phosphate acetyltransferase [Acholeplasmataceae bacterium]|nr:bifunctional enoyl-CoA hydratase/phosphate acetyltransferase [Acholeplasmataceae bacterium]